MYQTLLRPLQLRSISLANRIVMAPMSRYFATDGVPGEDIAAYYGRRAAAGVGMILTEGVSVPHSYSTDNPGTPGIAGDAALEGWRRVVEASHAHGVPILPQLWHQGPMWNVEYSQHREGAAAGLRPSGIWGPADGVISLREGAREKSLIPTQPMSEEEIADIIAAFGQGAANAMAAGFDGVAIHGAHGYLIDSFLWEYTNRRSDRWGGSRSRRAEFGAEVVRTIRRTIGPDKPIVLRISQFKMQDYRARLASNADELAELLGPLADAGVDLFDCSQRYFDTPVFDDDTGLNLAGWVQKLTGICSMAVGGVGLDKGSGQASHQDITQRAVNNIDRAIERMEQGEFELLAVGRSLLNDPRWFERVLRGEELIPFDPANLKRLT